MWPSRTASRRMWWVLCCWRFFRKPLRIALRPAARPPAQGQRPYMEDRHLVSGDISGQPHFSLYAVFDGHGGSRAAHFCARNMSLVLNRKMLEGASPEGVRNPSKALAETFAELDRWWLSLAENAVPPMDDGTTAVAALVVTGPAAAQCGEPAPGDSLPLVFVANTGDSRAVVVLDNGQAVALSDDHKPNRPDELARIRKAGGQVSFYGVWRVQGILAVSRAIGDRALKQYIVPSPEISRYAVPRKAKYLVLATDGLWDVMSNTELVAVLSSVPAGDTTAAANVLLREALSRGSQDNVTVLVVDLTKQQYPPPPESASPPPRHTPPVVEEEVFHAPDAVDGSSSMRQRVKARAEAASAAAHVPDAAAGTASPAVPSASGQPAARARKWAKHKDSAGLGSGGAVGSAALRALAERSPAPSPGASRASSPDPVPADGGDKAD